MSSLPRVAIIGRPNVGKSTLFNRLVGRRKALVHDKPGVTRDRIDGQAVLDASHTIEVVDTGGLMKDNDPWGLWHHVLLAAEESDLLVLVVDGREGPTIGDEQVLEPMRRLGKPMILVVNKTDTREARERLPEFHRLGIAPVVALSAEHGRGIEELREALAAVLPEASEPAAPEAPAVAIVGRPNVGKSSLLNRLVGSERALVSPVAGTTRDPVDTLVRRGEREYLFIDTAGIRRRSRITDAPDEVAVLLARRQIERAAVAVLVIDAGAGVTSGDLSIAGVILELGRACMVVVNKWDLLDPDGRQKLETSYERLDGILGGPPRVNTSATSGRGVEKIFAALDRSIAGFRLRLETSTLNKLIEEAVGRFRPPALHGSPWKVYYATQVGTGPPTFLVFANRTLPREDPYRRYLTNRLREALDLPGVPLRLVLRKRE
ncbi:MAG TPA: ribosome biogenesis GTPase Der [Thermoanaerobaculia bacterium]|nr:ribosome biogenesis GTPase Der [Thermoanaerobaculia bacterium]